MNIDLKHLTNILWDLWYDIPNKYPEDSRLDKLFEMTYKNYLKNYFR